MLSCNVYRHEIKTFILNFVGRKLNMTVNLADIVSVLIFVASIEKFVKAARIFELICTKSSACFLR